MTAELVEVGVDVVRALEGRRAAAMAVEMPGRWLFESPSLEGLVAIARRLARVPTTPIVIQGERGCGVKELARLVHDADPTAVGAPFKALPAQFVNAAEMRRYPLHGTLFIEDVEKLSPNGQAWLAGLLAARDVATRPLRVIAGSRFSVGELLTQATLGEELIHALDVSRMRIPPLRERPEEIVSMARRVLSHYAARLKRPFLRFTEGAEQRLRGHLYPSNACELRNVVERAVALSAADECEIGETAIVFYDGQDEAPGRCGALLGRRAATATLVGRLPSLAEMEKEYLVMLIRELRGRRTEISRTMGVSYPTVLKKIAHHRLDVRAIVGADADGGQAG